MKVENGKVKGEVAFLSWLGYNHFSLFEGV